MISPENDHQSQHPSQDEDLPCDPAALLQEMLHELQTPRPVVNAITRLVEEGTNESASGILYVVLDRNWYGIYLISEMISILDLGIDRLERGRNSPNRRLVTMPSDCETHLSPCLDTLSGIPRLHRPGIGSVTNCAR